MFIVLRLPSTMFEHEITNAVTTDEFWHECKYAVFVFNRVLSVTYRWRCVVWSRTSHYRRMCWCTVLEA